MLNGIVAPARAGMIGFDTDTALTATTAAQLKAAGFAFAVRYLSRTSPQNPGDLSAPEAELILAAGLGLMLVQHCPRSGWLPSAERGLGCGQAAVGNAQAIGVPAGVSIGYDLEEVAAYATAADTLDDANEWQAATAAWSPMLYVGANQPLSGDDLYWRWRGRLYWRSASTVPDVPYRGYAMRQALMPSPVDGVAIDRNVVTGDAFGGVPSLLMPR